MEEIRNENVNDIEEIEEVEAAPEGSGVVEVAAIIVGAVVAVGAGVGALVYKNRGKIDEWRINRLRKKGYVISKIEEAEYVEDEDSDEVEAE